MRITIYVHHEDLENLCIALAGGDKLLPINLDDNSVRVLNQATEDYVQISLTYDEYIKCTDSGVFEQLLSL